MAILRRLVSVKLLVASLLGGALLAGPLSPPASAGTVTTECTLMAQNNPSAFGQPASFRFFAAARFPEEVGPSPIGIVNFFDGLDFLGSEFVPLNGTKDNSSAILTTSSLSEGDHTITAIAVLDTGPCPDVLIVSQHVNPPPAQPSTTTVGSSANPSRSGQVVTFSADVTRHGGGAVSGSVQFQADGGNLGGPVPVDGSGHASIDTSSLSVGDHTITAAFTSTNDNTEDSNGSVTQTVQKADTVTVASSSPNPSEFGTSVTFSAHVDTSAPGGGGPTGTVQFSDGGTDIGGPQPVDGSGNASFSTSSLSIGNHTIGAAYSGDGTHNASSGSTSQTVEKVKTVLTYDGATSGDFHDPATLSATLTRRRDGVAIAGKSVHLAMASESCDATTNGAGKASCSITPQEPAGSYTAAASFAGDAGNQPSSASTPFTVTREQTTLTYTGATVILNGSALHASALLREDDGAPVIPGRSVTFTVGAGASAQSCTALTDASGRAACDIATLSQPLGPATIRSTFAQDAYYLASSDSDSLIIYAFPSRGAFTIGDLSATSGATVDFFGSQWDKDNRLSGGSAPSSFKGFATGPGTPPSCGRTFTADPGNSGNPPDSVPSYMGTIVTSKVTKSGSNVSGTITHLVVVKVSSYGSSPGKGGAGTVVATIC